MLVCPLIRLLPFRHTKLNGPLPDAVVLKMAVSPGQLVVLINCVALTLVNTVKVPLLVTLPHAPLTVTL